MRVAVVAEFYPRADDPVLGVWAHRQALAARDAGADVSVFVLHRVVPAKHEFGLRALRRKLAQPRRVEMDGIAVRYVAFVSPPRGRSYGSWGRWAAPPLRRALRGERFDLVHAHYAVPAGDAVRRLGLDAPLVVSNHGGDVFFTAERSKWVRPTYAAARLALANSAAIADATRGLGARDVRVVRLGTDVPDDVVRGDGASVVTVGHVVARKRHEDVIRAVAQLDGVRYEVVGDGPERARLERLAAELGVDARWHGQLPPADALRAAWRCDVMAMPSTDEAFGVAYVEAMAGGLPAIGRAGEPGPEEIASLGGGMLLTRGDDLPQLIRRALDERDALGAAARETVQRHFTWEQCGRATVEAYEAALR